ncbi:hypothetical protein [Paraliobacillus sp. JSM ZJ581]|uniref:hypothetical protein n=1 Tax=Paraliobacillus sp. JSM ZJ581 TaxID=3342118 RepID=UPI0035A98669
MFDHTSQKMRFYQGFRLLTFNWSDDVTFKPVDFPLLDLDKTQLQQRKSTFSILD